MLETTRGISAINSRKGIHHKSLLNPPPVSQVSAVEDHQENLQDKTSDTIAFIENIEGKKIISDSVLVKVNKLNNLSCDCFALLDSGSPISLISSVAYKQFFTNDKSILLPSLSYKAANNLSMKIIGKLESTIKLEPLRNFPAISITCSR